MTNELNETTALSPQPAIEIREFKLDAVNFSVEINVSPNPERLRIVEALMTKPASPKTYLDLLVRREAMTSTEYVEEDATQERIKVSGVNANAKLFDEIGKQIKGVLLPGEDKELAKEMRRITPEISEVLYSNWKSEFINGMYKLDARLRDDSDADFVVLGGSDHLTVDLTVGDEENPVAVITFDLPEPSETERESYQENAVKLLQPKGAKKQRTRIVTDLQRVVKFFDKLMERDGADIRIENDFVKATVKGKTFAETQAGTLERKLFLEAVDPLYKRAVISALMTKYQSKVQD